MEVSIWQPASLLPSSVSGLGAFPTLPTILEDNRPGFEGAVLQEISFGQNNSMIIQDELSSRQIFFCLCQSLHFYIMPTVSKQASMGDID